MDKLLAIIPARANSKRLPDKNIKLLCGKPLISYSIEAAKNSKYISRVIISTDSEKIASIALGFGAEVPFIRPEYLSRDESTSVDVIKHAILNLEKNGEKSENFILLQPTSPLRMALDIDAAAELYFSKKSDSVISIVEVPQRPEWFVKKNEHGNIELLFKDGIIPLQRNNYLLNGAIYIFSKKLIFNNNSLISDNSYAYLMPRERSIDIDTEFDFKITQLLIIDSLK